MSNSSGTIDGDEDESSVTGSCRNQGSLASKLEGNILAPLSPTDLCQQKRETDEEMDPGYSFKGADSVSLRWPLLFLCLFFLQCFHLRV